MSSIKLALRETAVIAAIVALCTGGMIGVYALIGCFSMPVLWGGLMGAAIAMGNHFFMALSAVAASEKAIQQEEKQGAVLMQGSYFLRLIVMFLLLLLGVKVLGTDVLASVLPILFVRPAITLAGLLEKKGATKK